MYMCKKYTFITSNLSSSHRTNTEDDDDKGRDVEREDTSWARRLALVGLWVAVADVSIWWEYLKGILKTAFPSSSSSSSVIAYVSLMDERRYSMGWLIDEWEM